MCDNKSEFSSRLARDDLHDGDNANVSKSASRCRVVEEINTACGYFPHVEILSISKRPKIALQLRHLQIVIKVG